MVSDLFENSLEELGSDSYHLFYHPCHPCLPIIPILMLYYFGFDHSVCLICIVCVDLSLNADISYLSLGRIVEAGHKNVVSDPNPATFIVEVILRLLIIRPSVGG